MIQQLKIALLAALAMTLPFAAAESQAPAAAAPGATLLSYSDLADLAVAAPIVAHVRLRRAVPLKPTEAGAVPAGRARHYVEGDILSLIRGPAGSAAQISFLADFPLGPNGKPAKLAKKSEWLVFGTPVAGRPSELRLVAPDAQLPFTPSRAASVREILREAASATSPPRITGIGKAFHVPGSLPGESETQIFLQGEGGRPVSLSVLRRPGEIPRWAVALGEMVDDAAGPPRPNSLLWYRLACSLPANLPAASLADAEPQHRGAIQADYRLVVQALGRCGRTRTSG
jgi:hypothetical protein